MHIGESVQGIRVFLPSRNFARSRQFYDAIGFNELWCHGKLALFRLGQYSFFLQDHFVEEWASHCMLDLRVSDTDAFWAHLQSIKLPEPIAALTKFGPPKDDESVGVRRGHFIDPSGVLWHYSQRLS